MNFRFIRKLLLSFAFLYCGTVLAQNNRELDSMLTVYHADSASADAVLMCNIGAEYYQAYTYEGYNKALIFYQRALDKAKKTHNERITAIAYKLIAGVYDAINMNMDTAALYYQRGLEYDLRSTDTFSIIQSYRNVVVISDKLHNEDKRLYYSDKLYNYLRAFKNEDCAMFKNQLSIYFSQKRVIGKAEELFTPIDVKKEAQENIESFRNYYYAGHFLYQAQRKYKEGIDLLTSVLPYTKLTVDSISIYKFLSEHYLDLGDYKNAFIYLDKNSVLSSAYEHGVNTDKIAETVTFYRNEQKEKESIALKEKAESQLKLRNYMFVVLFLLVLVVVIIALFARQTAKRNTQLKLQKEEVERLNKLNQKIFSVISHDFHAPLMSMNLLLKILKSLNYQKEDLDEYATDISNQISQSKLILENLLSWARAELNMQQPFPGMKISSNVHTVVEEVIPHLQSPAVEKKLTIVNNIPEGINVGMLPDILKIIFRNLLSNAIKFSYTNGSIEFGMDPTDRTFFIKDNGVGIDPKKLELLFKEAVGNKLGTSNETGFGLGLYMTYELVHKSNGKIMVKSEQGKGTIFILALPGNENT
ncbi:MAG: hypothetical protein JWP12_1964 [Bacteroidetes bacterium]|nr:hypothetical protein [Bacteroidota bacterium]